MTTDEDQKKLALRRRRRFLAGVRKAEAEFVANASPRFDDVERLLAELRYAR